jgi:hypothetical protein
MLNVVMLSVVMLKVVGHKTPFIATSIREFVGKKWRFLKVEEASEIDGHET